MSLNNYEHFYRYYYDPDQSILNQVALNHNISEEIITNIISITSNNDVKKIKSIYQYSDKLKRSGFH